MQTETKPLFVQKSAREAGLSVGGSVQTGLQLGVTAVHWFALMCLTEQEMLLTSLF